MYRITAHRTIKGDLTAIWRLVTDVDNWPTWDPHEEAARLDGEFVVGGTGWSKPRGGPATTWTITEVVEHRSWASECALPGGKLTGRTEFTDVGDGTVHCTKTIDVHGPLVPLFRLWFGKRIRADLDHTFAAMGTEIGKVTA